MAVPALDLRILNGTLLGQFVASHISTLGLILATSTIPFWRFLISGELLFRP